MGQKVPELRDALTLLGSQLASMQHSKADRGKTERQLKSKVDGRDRRHRGAPRGRQGRRPGPDLSRQTQGPALKCLSCDRPLTLAPRTEAGIFAGRLRGRRTIKSRSLGRGPRRYLRAAARAAVVAAGAPAAAGQSRGWGAPAATRRGAAASGGGGSKHLVQ